MVYLDSETRKLLKVMAKSKGIPEAQVIRDALKIHLRSERIASPRVVGRSQDGGVARNADKALQELGFGRISSR